MDLKEVLGIISTSLGVVERISNAPGISLLKLNPIVGTVSSAVGALKLLIDAGMDFAPLASKLAATFKPDAPEPTQAEMDALDADTDAELAKLRAMPPKEDGEQD